MEDYNQPLLLGTLPRRDAIDLNGVKLPRRRAQIRRGSLPIVAGSAFVLFLAAFFLVSPNQNSINNDLIFKLSKSDSPLKSYPVPLTAGVIPKRFHSHNDYEQSVPLFKALSYGASSVEADIWLVDGQLLVGHTTSELSPNKTLASLYLDPLQAIIETANANKIVDSQRTRGIFESAPQLSLQLLIDIKTDGPTTFSFLYSALEPLRSAGCLTTVTFNLSSVVQPSIITVVGTGNTPLESVQALGNSTAPRDVFLDAPLDGLSNDIANVYNSTISPLASVDFGMAIGSTWMIPPIGRRRIRRLTDAAHKKSIQARFWNTPPSPTWARNFIWQILLDEGSDWLNVDDLVAASEF